MPPPPTTLLHSGLVPELRHEDESSWTKRTMHAALSATQTLLMEGLGDWERAHGEGELGIDPGKYLGGKQWQAMADDDGLYM
jgi:hypothetical protein